MNEDGAGKKTKMVVVVRVVGEQNGSAQRNKKEEILAWSSCVLDLFHKSSRRFAFSCGLKIACGQMAQLQRHLQLIVSNHCQQP